ncbi:MAG: divalent metal cation transporter [Candidatus Methylomirabilis sp.]|nr:divalent metal cation transporter [Candidatus Methylomirabilis sp.]
MAASLEIFGVSRYLTVPFAALIVSWLVVKGTYRLVERIFLGASLFTPSIWYQPFWPVRRGRPSCARQSGPRSTSSATI